MKFLILVKRYFSVTRYNVTVVTRRYITIHMLVGLIFLKIFNFWKILDLSVYKRIFQYKKCIYFFYRNAFFLFSLSMFFYKHFIYIFNLRIARMLKIFILLWKNIAYIFRPSFYFCGAHDDFFMLILYQSHS